MLYNIGDVLVCKEAVNAQCLEMTNPCFNIKPGDKYVVSDKDDYPNDNGSHWYELTSQKENGVILNAWNDEGHMIIDDKFRLDVNCSKMFENVERIELQEIPHPHDLTGIFYNIDYLKENKNSH